MTKLDCTPVLVLYGCVGGWFGYLDWFVHLVVLGWWGDHNLLVYADCNGSCTDLYRLYKILCWVSMVVNIRYLLTYMHVLWTPLDRQLW